MSHHHVGTSVADSSGEQPMLAAERAWVLEPNHALRIEVAQLGGLTCGN